MSWAIRLTGVPDGGYDCRIRNPWENYWLVQYDPNANCGLGDATFDKDPTKARRFESFDDAKACWFAQSTVLPDRERFGTVFENRPLAVCDIAIDEV